MAMTCQRCKKKPATVHITDVVKGTSDKRELHICETCADELGIVQKQHKSLDEILTNFIQAHAGMAEPAGAECPNCGLSWSQFKQSGLLGCPQDYDLFSEKLIPLLERAHNGATHHSGKVPKRVDSGPRAATTLIRLKRELQTAVEMEDYKRAATLRDQIRITESEMSRTTDRATQGGRL